VVHAHSDGHGHHHDARASVRSVGRLRLAFGLTVAFLVTETATAVATGSLALLGDAAHMLTDAVAIALSLAAISVAARAPLGGARTFGLYRLEIFASLANAALLLGAAGYILVEAGIRLDHGHPHVDAVPMLVVAVVGLAVNVVVYAMLRAGARASLAVEGAVVDAMADAAGSVGVIVAAVVIEVSGWTPIDPILAVLMGLWIAPRTVRLAGRSLRVLLQVAPAHVDLGVVRDELLALPGVVDVHDLHVWTLTSEMDVASAHVMIAPGVDSHGVLDQARALLRDHHDIAHATIQVEPDDHTGCFELNW
jgi:cobalt-zinc-cadmium efflux system protein